MNFSTLLFETSKKIGCRNLSFISLRKYNFLNPRLPVEAIGKVTKAGLTTGPVSNLLHQLCFLYWRSSLIYVLNVFETWSRSTCRAGRQRTSPGPSTSRSPARKVAIMVGRSLEHHTGWTKAIIGRISPNLGFWPSILHRAPCNQSFPLETKNNALYSKLISVRSWKRNVK